MNTKQLKAKVLDLAIHGKLLSPETVAELKKSPDYETADVLLEKIRKEKEEKIAKGELKRDKKDSYIFVGDDKRHYEKFADGTVKDIEDEIPFDVPEGWAWARIASLVSINLGLTHTPKYVEKGIPFYSVKDISNGYLDESEPKYVSQEEFNTFLEGAKPRKGDIIFCRVGTIGKPHIVSVDYPFGIFVSVGFFRKYSERINSKYIMDWMNSPFFYEQVDYNVKGGVIKNLNTGWLSEFLIPIPSEKEQQEIAFRIDEIFSKIALLEENKTELQKTVTYAKAKILDLAIHGKLVPQDTNDEPASVLLEKLRAEKEEKIAKGELKRDKNDSFIYKGSDNCYYQKFNKGDGLLIQEKIKFEIPEGWSWCLLRNICSDFIVPQRDKPTRFDGTIPWCRIEDIEGKYLNGSLSNQLVSMKTIKAMNMHICPKGSIICSCSASIGVQAIATVDCCTNQTFIGIVPIEEALFNEYLYYFLGSQTKYFLEIATGTTIKYISRDKFEDFIFPLPPLAEQKRIVDKIENAFAKLDQIAEQLA